MLKWTAVLTILACATLTAQAPPDRRLTTADVEKVSAGTGVKLVARGTQPGAGGDLNFTRADGKLILMVNFGDAKLYTRAHEQKEITVSGKSYPMELYAHAVTGVGDEAFASPPGPVQYVIYARKGNNAITVSSYYGGAGAGNKPLLTEPQLKTIAQLIFSRW